MFSEDEDFDLFEDLDILEDFEVIRKPKVYKIRADPFSELDDEEFYSRYRFDKTTVQFLVENISIPEPVTNRGLPIPKILKVLVTLHFFGRNIHQSDVGSLHGIVQSTVGKIIATVSKSIASLLPDFIKFPSSTEEFNVIKREFYKIAKFPKVIGAIDCTHVHIKRPTRTVGPVMVGHYINKKGNYSLNIQIVTDSNCKIIDIVARSRGSLHDANIWNNCLLKRKLEETKSVHRGLLLGDAGYPCSNILLTPIRNPTNQKEERYNNSHTSTRSRIECLNGQLKSKFRSLLDRLRVDLDTAKNVIVAVAVLHNIAKERNINFLGDEDVAPGTSRSNQVDSSNDDMTTTGTTGRAFRNAFVNQYF